jgi:hypothetical protein
LRQDSPLSRDAHHHSDAHDPAGFAITMNF